MGIVFYKYNNTFSLFKSFSGPINQEKCREEDQPHKLVKSNTNKRRKCNGCYKILRKYLSSREADKKVKLVYTFCEKCERQPAYCLDCFNRFHEDITV